MIAVLKDCLERLLQGEDLVFVFISDKAGSSPRNPGSCMLVSSKGLVCGSIGGGKIEYVALEHAAQLLKEGAGDQVQYNLSTSEASNTGMACGGQNDVHFTYLSASESHLVQLARLLSPLLRDNNELAKSFACFSLDKDDHLSLSLYHEGSFYGKAALVLDQQNKDELAQVLEKKTERFIYHSCLIAGQECRLMCLRLQASPRLHIFGGGHVSRALSKVFAPLDFEVIVYEDRIEFAQEADFAPGTQTRLMDMHDIYQDVQTSSADYICVITRGHSYDELALRQLLRKPHAYLGCIGSKNKAKFVRNQLSQAGFSEEEINTIYCPIGLNLGNSQPEEIAISIAAQILQHKSLGYCDAKER